MIHRFTKFFDQTRVWNEAGHDNSYFLNKYHNELKNITLGCSYSPEHIEWLTQRKSSYTHAAEKGFNGTSNRTPQDCLGIIVRDFHLHDIRFGLRWNSIDTGESLDLSYYDPMLDDMFNGDNAVTLNVGPIKTFRWPEQYVPDYVLNSISLPGKGTEIRENSELAKYSYEYLHKLYEFLFKTCSSEQLSHIKTIQLENEPFHKFGIHKWRMSEAYMKELIKITLKYFPNVNFLINSSEMRNVRTISRFYSSLIAEMPKLHNRLILGYNYFYNVPGERIIKGIGRVDSITLTKFSRRNVCEKNIEWGRKIGYVTEVTEAQVEPWDPIITPGNSAQEFRFLLARCIENLIDCSRPSVIRLWGIEHLALRYKRNDIGSEHDQIIELIQAINKNS